MAEHKIQKILGEASTAGPVLWILTVEYFVTEVAAALSFAGGYSWRFNEISDLGDPRCGVFNEHFICSPLHFLVNLSFIGLGALMVIGSFLMYKYFAKSRGIFIGFSFLALSGFGAIFVGIFQEHSISVIHVIAAAVSFIAGIIAIFTLSFSLRHIHISMRVYTFLMALVSTTAFVFLARGTYFVLGKGGMERLVSYPQVLWLIVFGVYLLLRQRGRFREKEL